MLARHLAPVLLKQQPAPRPWGARACPGVQVEMANGHDYLLKKGPGLYKLRISDFQLSASQRRSSLG